MSNGPITAPKRFRSSVSKLCAQIRANGGTPVLFATWAYKNGGAELTRKGWGYEEMARKLSDTYRQAARENDALLAEVGRRFYEQAEARELYASDGVHPNEAGAQLAAETIAAVIQQNEETKR